MNKKTLSLGFIIAIVFAVTAFPTANSVPTGIADPNMVANGCTCHTDGIMASNVVITPEWTPKAILTSWSSFKAMESAYP